MNCWTPQWPKVLHLHRFSKGRVLLLPRWQSTSAYKYRQNAAIQTHHSPWTWSGPAEGLWRHGLSERRPPLCARGLRAVLCLSKDPQMWLHPGMRTAPPCSRLREASSWARRSVVIRCAVTRRSSFRDSTTASPATSTRFASSRSKTSNWRLRYKRWSSRACRSPCKAMRTTASSKTCAAPWSSSTRRRCRYCSTRTTWMRICSGSGSATKMKPGSESTWSLRSGTWRKARTTRFWWS